MMGRPFQGAGRVNRAGWAPDLGGEEQTPLFFPKQDLAPSS